MAVRKKNTPAKENKTKSKASKPVSKRTLTKTTSTKRSITARSGPRALTRSAAADIAQPTRISSDFSRNALGIDISLYNPDVDWQQVKASGVSFAYIKATEGISITDPSFAQHWQNARDVGILRGAYHFFRPTQDPIVQARRFVETIGVGASDLPPALDIEIHGNQVTASMLAENVGNIQTWLVTVERLLGVRPVVYTNLGSWGEVVQLLGGVTPDWLTRYPLWAANWVYRYTDGDQPRFPPGWTQWTFWQFDSPDKADWVPLVSVAGIPKGVDLNLFHGSEAELRGWVETRRLINAPHTIGSKTLFHGSNQDVINVFYFTFGMEVYWNKVEACALTYLVDDRIAPYTGPSVEDLPNLSETDRNALRRTLIPTVSWPQFGFIADRTVIQAGEAVQLSWQISDGVEAVYFWNGGGFEGVGGNDHRTVAPSVSSEYYLKVMANGGQQYWSDRIHIDVRAPLGTNTAQPQIGLHMMVNDPFPAGNRGCRFVMCMGKNPARANEFKRAFPDAVVMYRHILERNQNVSPQQMFELLQVTGDSELVYTGQNEGDQSPYGTQGQLRRRAEFDVEVAKLVKAAAPKSIYAAGSFATLNPDFRDPTICQAMREGYADAYNSGLTSFDMHLYSRDYDHVFVDTELFDECNWRNLFTKCGFDPRRRAIYAGETGIDDVLGVRPGKAGFSGMVVGSSAVVAWMRRWLELQGQPISVNGSLHPSPFVGGAIFQCGGNGDSQWNQYDVTSYLDAMRSIWNL